MLPTQLSYWANVENQRHNMAMERKERQKIELDTQRVQHESAKLQLSQKELNAQVAYWEAQVQARLAEIAELSRHNKVTEGLSAKELKVKKDQAKASLEQAQAALKNAQTAAAKLPIEQQQADASTSQARSAALKASVEQNKAHWQNITERAKALLTQNQAAKTAAERDKVFKDTELLVKEIFAYDMEHIGLPFFKLLGDIGKIAMLAAGGK